jgi:pyrimidine nucleoside transport protein
MHRLVSAGGLVIILLFGFLFSKHRRRIIWRQIIWALTLQFLFGILILRWEYGKAFFDCVGSKVDTFLEFTDVGSSFVFGYLVNQKPFNVGKLNSSVAIEVANEINANKAVFSIVVFKALSTVYFFRKEDQ